MIAYNINGIIQILGLRKSGDRGWYYGNCVFCGKRDHMGVKFDVTPKYPSPSYHCFKCQRQGSIYQIIKWIGRTDLITGKKDIDFVSGVKRLIGEETEGVDCSVKTVKKPIGFKFVDSNNYLDGRGMSPDQYRHLNIGLAPLDPRYQDKYVIFLITEDFEIKGYLGRAMLTTEEIEAYEESTGKKLPKYKNSLSDFGKLLGGFDEIAEGITKEVICVEGILDKASVDRNLGLYNSDEVKCCCTFGKKMSREQIIKLVNKGVERMILFYDPDAISAMRNVAVWANKYIDVSVAKILSNNDPGSMGAEEMMSYMSNTYGALEFYMNNLKLMKL